MHVPILLCDAPAWGCSASTGHQGAAASHVPGAHGALLEQLELRDSLLRKAPPVSINDPHIMRTMEAGRGFNHFLPVLTYSLSDSALSTHLVPGGLVGSALVLKMAKESLSTPGAQS